MKKIAIRYGEGPTAGNGHRVRMLRLAKALAQRGAEVDIRPANFVEILDTLKRGAHASFRLALEAPFDLLVMDVPSNDNAELIAFRPLVHRLAVVVGIGHTMNTETSWIADTIIYQNVGPDWDLLPAPGSLILSGTQHLMVDPRSESWRQAELGMGILSYFGAGFPDGYADEFLAELRRLLPRADLDFSGDGHWQDEWGRTAARARLVVASMGMAVNEAVAVGTPVVVVSVDEEHAKDAIMLARHAAVMHAGTLVEPSALALAAAEEYSLPRVARPVPPIDGLGVYRVARHLLQ